MAEARLGLEREYEERLELIKAEAAGRTAALRTRLTEATQRAEASATALSTTQAELASSQAELLLLQRRVDDAEVVVQRNADEIRQRQTLEHMHGPMLRTLRERANAALGNICEAAAEEPHVTNYAGNLRFFTSVVTPAGGGTEPWPSRAGIHPRLQLSPDHGPPLRLRRLHRPGA